MTVMTDLACTAQLSPKSPDACGAPAEFVLAYADKRDVACGKHLARVLRNMRRFAERRGMRGYVDVIVRMAVQR
jgi:hypothetical protein